MKYLIIPTLALSLLVSGCATTSRTSSVIKAEGVTVTTVDTGMKVWHDYVVAHLTDGKVNQAEIDAVANGYNIYYTAQLATEAALTKTVSAGSTNTVDIATANSAVLSAEGSLSSIKIN